MSSFLRIIGVGCVAFLVTAPAVRAQLIPTPPKEMEEIGYDEHLDALLPMDVQFRDEDGFWRPLSEYFPPDRPVILSLNYSNCPMLCDVQLTGLVNTLKKIKLKPGRDYEIISVSIDPRETSKRARETRDKYVMLYGDESTVDGWHFLTGKQVGITRLAETMGIRYVYLPKEKEYAHVAVFTVCTPQGRISRYFSGIEFVPKTLRLSLVEAGEGKIGTPMDKLLLFCFQFDASTGKYTVVALNMMKVGGIVTLVLLAGLLIPFWGFRSHHRKTAGRSDSSANPSDSDLHHHGTSPAPETQSTTEYWYLKP